MNQKELYLQHFNKVSAEVSSISECRLLHVSANRLTLLCTCGETFKITLKDFRKRKTKLCTDCKKKLTKLGVETRKRRVVKPVGRLLHKAYIVKSNTSQQSLDLRFIEEEGRYRILNMTTHKVGPVAHATLKAAEKSITDLIDSNRLKLIAVYEGE